MVWRMGDTLACGMKMTAVRGEAGLLSCRRKSVLLFSYG